MSDVQIQNPITTKVTPKPQDNRSYVSVPASQPANNAVNSIPARSIYQYPQKNIYPTNATTISQQDDAIVLNPSEKSAVNVYIQNPAGYMAPGYYNNQHSVVQPAQPTVAASSIEDKKPKKMKRIVDITDDYIRSLENYLRNPNKDIRLQGVKELVKRFEEDESRYDDPALNALLNIALQDKSSSIRSLAISLADSGVAKGDDKTLQILKNLTTDTSNYGIDAMGANSALLKMSAKKIEVEDNSPEKRNSIVYKL